MKRILALSLMLILMCFTAWAQPEPTSTPPSPESLGLTPPDPSASTQAPPASESDQALMSTSQYQASAAAPESHGNCHIYEHADGRPSRSSCAQLPVHPLLSIHHRRLLLRPVDSHVDGCKRLRAPLRL